MNAVDLLALARVRYEVAGYANYNDRAVDTVVWALTAGMAEVDDRVRRYHEDQEPTLAEAMNDGLQRDGQPGPFTSTRECCEHCNAETGHCDAHCPPF